MNACKVWSCSCRQPTNDRIFKAVQSNRRIVSHPLRQSAARFGTHPWRLWRCFLRPGWAYWKPIEYPGWRPRCYTANSSHQYHCPKLYLQCPKMAHQQQTTSKMIVKYIIEPHHTQIVMQSGEPPTWTMHTSRATTRIYAFIVTFWFEPRRVKSQSFYICQHARQACCGSWLYLQLYQPTSVSRTRVEGRRRRRRRDERRRSCHWYVCQSNTRRINFFSRILYFL